MLSLISKPVVKTDKVGSIPVIAGITWLPQVIYASCYPPSFQHTAYSSDAIIYQQFVTSLLEIAEREPDKRCLLLTSTCEGKSASWIVMNLVYFLCQSGQKVLLMDADFHSPSVHLAFDIEYDRSMQLLDCLDWASEQSARLAGPGKWEKKQEDFQTVEGIPGLSVLINAKATVSAFKNLDLSRFQQVLDELKEHFDWIIIDSAPILEGDETLAVARLVGGLVLIEDYNLTPQRSARIQNLIKSDEIRLIGKVERV